MATLPMSVSTDSSPGMAVRILVTLLKSQLRRSIQLVCEFGIRRIKKAQVVVYSPYVQVMAAAYPQKSNMQQALSINSL